ncbi:uncharacterized protein LOC125369313 [Ricinus communis]|uniref:uncharacterized protein LOC125369313 n=1 Tax=Ricinus communis TaxID=3988 RepID=UPI00201A5599|nr:uncharacterized protein LOC125369313 [Ricinus communis]
MGPYPSSNGNKYILVAVEYFSKWPEAQALPTDDARVTNRQVEVTNRGLKRILERTVGVSRKDWASKLDDALWAFRAAYRISIGFTPYRLVYGKSCHLLIELEHRALWALKTCNFDFDSASKERQWQLSELEEWRQQAYENSSIYKAKTKKWHDQRLKGSKEFQIGDRVLLYNSRLCLFQGKLKSRWSGPFVVKKVFPYGTVKLHHPKKGDFKVNGHRLKVYDGNSLEIEQRVNMILYLQG